MKFVFPEPQWLFRRLKAANPQVNPEFAFRGTIGWLRGLSILCDEKSLDRSSLLSPLSSKVKPRNPANDDADTAVCEYTFMALQNLSSLYVMKDANRSYDLARIAIISWYYGIYFAAKAMVAAYDGSTQETHAKTAKAWDAQVVQRGYISQPFAWRLDTLVKSEYEKIVKSLGDTFHIGKGIPSTEEEAVGACLAYLKGTAEHEREKAEADIKRSGEFKKLGVQNFRTNAAKQLRDGKLSNKTVCFLNQAFRYRGKANYRDTLYLSYGHVKEEELERFLEDLYRTLFAFLLQAGCYCELRAKKSGWSDFLDDLEKHGRLSVPLNVLGRLS